MPKTSRAVRDILAERERQISKEGWTPAHDDMHEDQSLAAAAACYARPRRRATASPDGWPRSWSLTWWKPTTRRRDLVKAGALIIAEIERLDREADDAR